MKKGEAFVPASQDEAFAVAGQKLRVIREQKGMSQEDVAFDAKVDQSTHAIE
ncbi:MAG TPA: hypothetical protein VFC45_08595 [Pseudolabrys sp.]|nr:hypothetical protein [Pseudolabrys sp.]